MKRIAVIGAGPSGLACLISFQSAMDKDPSLADRVELVCYERQESWGGIWNFNLETGTDEYGEPIHSSMYKYLFSNAPKECLEFADYSFEEHFGHPVASYPPREVLWHYIQGRVDKAGVREYCRFRTSVRDVAYDSAAREFHLTSHDLVEDQTQTETFDHVIVASGHFSTPNVPTFDGLDTNFKGTVLHSHDFRDAALYRGQDLLIVGCSYSAEDIALQSWKYGAKSVTISYRSGPLGFDWPSNVDERPILQSVDMDGVFHFRDGSTKKFDTVILCTGYLHHFPYLPDDLRLVTDNRLWPLNLYNGVVYEPNPALFYMGMQNQFYTFNMFDAQAYYVRDVILGRIVLPPPADMVAQSQRVREREEGLQTVSEMIWFQGNYVKDLMQQTDCPTYDMDGANRFLERWVQDKQEDILTYRDRAYPSLVTGTMSPTLRTKWVDAKRDIHFLQYFTQPKSGRDIPTPARGGRVAERNNMFHGDEGKREAAALTERPDEQAPAAPSPAERVGGASQLARSSPREVVGRKKALCGDDGVEQQQVAHAAEMFGQQVAPAESAGCASRGGDGRNSHAFAGGNRGTRKRRSLIGRVLHRGGKAA